MPARRGQALVIGGTSAVAPLNQKLPQPAGFLNPLLYGSLAGKGVGRDITSGTNGAFAAGLGCVYRVGQPGRQGVIGALGAGGVDISNKKPPSG